MNRLSICLLLNGYGRPAVPAPLPTGISVSSVLSVRAVRVRSERISTAAV